MLEESFTITAEPVNKFVEKSFNLCWLMAVQDPPVCLEQVHSHGETFDTNVYKHYTKVGHYIDYVVWPALKLYEKGSLLGKGIAQGMDSAVDTEGIQLEEMTEQTANET